jgi:hypothetical protein
MLKIAISLIALGPTFNSAAYAGSERMTGSVQAPVIMAQAVNPSPSRSTSALDVGLADRRAYEEWFASLTGDFKRGAKYWAGQRSLPKPGSCYLADGTSAGEWTEGCLAAQRQLAPSDRRRKAEPDYRQGWNAYVPAPLPAPVTTETPPAAEPSRAYAEGLADRQAWEHYFRKLSGPEKEGAEWWASHRSDPNNPSCFALKAEQYQNPKGGEVVTGCLSAKLQLEPTDKRRLSEPDYRQGWRSYAASGSQPTAPPAASVLVPGGAGIAPRTNPADKAAPAPANVYAMPTPPQEVAREAPVPQAAATSPQAEASLPVEGQCEGVYVLGVDRGNRCYLDHVRLPRGDQIFFVMITPNGMRRPRNEPAGPDDIMMAFHGREVGLIGGVNPRFLGGPLSVGEFAHSDPQVLRSMGQYFFVIDNTMVLQKREWFSTVRERLPPVSPNEGGVTMEWHAPGYCQGSRIEFGNGSWLLECKAIPNPGNTNFLRFISAGPPP